MRISDWSSDVCSSDLLVVDRQLQGYELAGQVAEPAIVGRLEAERLHIRRLRRHHDADQLLCVRPVMALVQGLERSKFHGMASVMLRLLGGGEAAAFLQARCQGGAVPVDELAGAVLVLGRIGSGPTGRGSWWERWGQLV